VGAAHAILCCGVASWESHLFDSNTDGWPALSVEADWDVGRYKAECSANAVVSSMSAKPSTARAHSILCNDYGIPMTSTAAMVDFFSATNRRDTSTGTWDSIGFMGEWRTR